MDILQERILEIALQLPGYLGYEAKDRRRDLDKYTRGQLSKQYGEMDTYLARVRKNASLEYIVDLENLDQKIQRLIARFNTAPTGYAGWFDSAQIGEDDIDALTQFDAFLANGVPQLKDAIDKIAAALKSKAGIEDTIGICAELLDALNARFDQREQFLATGKRPALSLLSPRPLESPLKVFEKNNPPDDQFVPLTNLNLNDAVSFDGSDYIIVGKMVYAIARGSFWAYLLQDGSKQHWLRIGPGNELATCQEVELDVPSELSDTLNFKTDSYQRMYSGTAKVSVEGSGGARHASVEYAVYGSNRSDRLWIENFGVETRVMAGQVIEANELKVYRK
jgi:hypothetical protein